MDPKNGAKQEVSFLIHNPISEPVSGIYSVVESTFNNDSGSI